MCKKKTKKFLKKSNEGRYILMIMKTVIKILFPFAFPSTDFPIIL